MEGRLISNGTGTLSNAGGDVNAYGTDYVMNFTAANYTVSNTATGRGTMNLAFTFGGTPDSMNFVFYVVNSGKLFVMESDAVTTATPLLNGVAVQQQTPVGGFSLVAYLVNLNQIFLFVSDANVLFGSGEPQAGVSFTNSALKGTYAGFATNPVDFAVTVFSGEFAADGASPTGTLTGTEDIGAPSGPNPGVPFNASYSVSPSPANGRGTMTVTSGTGGNAVIYMISASKFVAVSLNDPTPAVLQSDLPSPAPASVPLSPVSVNPTSVAGGNSSTGTVTLSGAAPSGGAVVTLSSSNTTAARTPSSVTIAAGATSATFTVSTSAVLASTTVSISGTYGVATTSALPATPPPPPPPLTPSPSTLTPPSVVGGLESSTGTVTLTRAAPTGGAIVVLSSSNGAARVPSSVIVPAGASSASFTVSTSIVLISTSSKISASYNGTTRAATLGVLL